MKHLNYLMTFVLIACAATGMAQNTEEFDQHQSV